MAWRRIGCVCALCVGLLVWPHATRGHDWYPIECCSERDCAPADTVVRRDDGSYFITSRGMSVTIPADYQKWRNSPDERIHVCIRKLRSGSEYLICAFRAPGL
jgi:hypothetical protein